MPRILLLIILLWVVYVVIKRFITSSTSDDSSKEKTREKAPQSEKIVACSQCGLHIPESESHLTDKMIYCNSPECNTPK